MKKLAIAAAVAALATGAANAYTVGTFANGFVVPNVIHNGANETTAVGLVNQSGATVAVYWTFFDQNSAHITDGCFPMTDKDYESFVWSDKSGTGLENKRGYLVFAVGSAAATSTVAQTACGAAAQLSTVAGVGLIAGNAFQVNLAGKSVAFVPVIDGALTVAPATADLTTMGATTLTTVAGAAQAGTNSNFSMRYFVDGATGGTDTRIVVWSTGDQKKSHTVNIYNDKQERKSVNFDLAFTELDFFDPETIVGRPANFTDGIVEWNPTVASFSTGTVAVANASVYTYSVITAPSFGAVQTVLGSHR